MSSSGGKTGSMPSRLMASFHSVITLSSSLGCDQIRDMTSSAAAVSTIVPAYLAMVSQLLASQVFAFDNMPDLPRCEAADDRASPLGRQSPLAVPKTGC